jgi:hypothetical protein
MGVGVNTGIPERVKFGPGGRNFGQMHVYKYGFLQLFAYFKFPLKHFVLFIKKAKICFEVE